ncbi:MAG: hypothetical protein ACYTHN_23490, partial [Planctomycetota bacterium]
LLQRPAPDREIFVQAVANSAASVLRENFQYIRNFLPLEPGREDLMPRDHFIDRTAGKELGGADAPLSAALLARKTAMEGTLEAWLEAVRPLPREGAPEAGTDRGQLEEELRKLGYL